MAQSPEQPRERGSDFISKLVKDPKNPPQTQQVVGYLGAAGEAGRTRIYLDTTLQNYVEVPEEKVLHVEAMGERSLGLSIIWLSADAQIFTPAPPQMDARSYFGGAIYQDYLGQGAAVAGEAALPATYAIYCRPTMHVPCPTYVDYCTLIGRCTAYPGCQGHYTAFPGCHVAFDRPGVTPEFSIPTHSELTCPTYIAPCTRVAPLCIYRPSVLEPCRGGGGLPFAQQMAAGAAQQLYPVQTQTVPCPSALCTRALPYCTFRWPTTEPFFCPSVASPCVTRAPLDCTLSPLCHPPASLPVYCYGQPGGVGPIGDPLAGGMAAQALHPSFAMCSHAVCPTRVGPECPMQTVQPACVTRLPGCGGEGNPLAGAAVPGFYGSFAVHCAQTLHRGCGPAAMYDPYAGYYGA